MKEKIYNLILNLFSKLINKNKKVIGNYSFPATVNEATNLVFENGDGKGLEYIPPEDGFICVKSRDVIGGGNKERYVYVGDRTNGFEVQSDAYTSGRQIGILVPVSKGHDIFVNGLASASSATNPASPFIASFIRSNASKI